jgi:hypothetical protein
MKRAFTLFSDLLTNAWQRFTSATFEAEQPAGRHKSSLAGFVGHRATKRRRVSQPYTYFEEEDHLKKLASDTNLSSQSEIRTKSPDKDSYSICFQQPTPMTSTDKIGRVFAAYDSVSLLL